MTTFETTSRVGPDGKLLVTLPPSMANTEVRVTVEPANGRTASAPGRLRTRAEWREFIRSTAGTITDPTFQRLPEGGSAQREPLD